jgi:predicted nucleic acid-binding protein
MKAFVDTGGWVAYEILIQYDDQKFSFTDCTSFALCEREQITHVVTVDRHFRTMRMILLPPGLVLP